MTATFLQGSDMLKKLCSACEAPLTQDTGLCAMCFTENNMQNYRLGCDYMTRLQFIITDVVPGDLKTAIVQAGSSKLFAKYAKEAKILVLLKYKSRYIAGLAGSHQDSKAGLYLDFWSVPRLPKQLAMFMGALMIAAALKGDQEELIMPPILAKRMKQYWTEHLPLLEVPDFIDAGDSKKLLLRNLSPNFVRDSMEAIQRDFSELIDSPEFSSSMKQLESGESSK